VIKYCLIASVSVTPIARSNASRVPRLGPALQALEQMRADGPVRLVRHHRRGFNLVQGGKARSGPPLPQQRQRTADQRADGRLNPDQPLVEQCYCFPIGSSGSRTIGMHRVNGPSGRNGELSIATQGHRSRAARPETKNLTRDRCPRSSAYAAYFAMTALRGRDVSSGSPDGCTSGAQCWMKSKRQLRCKSRPSDHALTAHLPRVWFRTDESTP